MGDLAWMLALPAHQLAFPFTPSEQRRLALVECFSGTTLRDTTQAYLIPCERTRCAKNRSTYHEGGNSMMTNTIDFPGLLEAFKRALHSEDTSKNTTSAYLSDLVHFVSWYAQTIGIFQIDEITPTDIRACREFLQEQLPPTAPATINRRLAALRRFFSWAKENHLTESQPTERIRNVEMTSNGPKSLDRKQWHRLQRSVEQAKGIQGIRDRCILLLLFHTGLRAGDYVG
jgi:integrase